MTIFEVITTIAGALLAVGLLMAVGAVLEDYFVGERD